MLDLFLKRKTIAKLISKRLFWTLIVHIQVSCFILFIFLVWCRLMWTFLGSLFPLAVALWDNLNLMEGRCIAACLCGLLLLYYSEGLHLNKHQVSVSLGVAFPAVAAETRWGSEGEEEGGIQFHHRLALSWRRWEPPTSPWLLGNMSCFCWGPDRRLTSAVHVAAHWPWRGEVKWSLWMLSSELSVLGLISPGGFDGDKMGHVTCITFKCFNCWFLWSLFP